MNPDLIAAIGGVITASGLVLTGILGTRSKVKLDDIDRLNVELDEARDDLAKEREERVIDRASQKARHDAEIAHMEGRVETLTRQLDERDRTINKLDRLVLVMRTHVAKLSRKIVDLGDEPPTRPAEMDE
jgi:predicted RNase H-like nuclease (RuvC/YqgF family)